MSFRILVPTLCVGMPLRPLRGQNLSTDYHAECETGKAIAMRIVRSRGAAEEHSHAEHGNEIQIFRLFSQRCQQAILPTFPRRDHPVRVGVRPAGIVPGG